MTNREDTRTLAQLASEAINVQDACNLSGVVHGFSRSITRLRALLEAAGQGGTEAVNTHPICQLWADKIAHLAGTQQAGLGELAGAYAAVHQIVSEARYARFATWADVVAHCKAGLPLYYHAPLDVEPRAVDYKLPTRKPRGSMVGGDGWKECIRIIPRTNDADPFVAFMDHCSRMRRLAAEET